MQALEMARSLHSGDHREILSSLSTMVWLTHDMAEFEAAEAYIHEYNAMNGRLNPANSGKRLITELGLLYKDMGRYADAETLLLASHEDVVARADGLSKGLANSHFSLGKLYTDMGDLARAESEARKALELHIQNPW